MKELLVSLLLVTQFSCISKAQENDTTTQILTTDSLQTDTLSLLFAGDLMQHQGQINVARTSTGYDYAPQKEDTIIRPILNMSKTKSKVLTLP